MHRPELVPDAILEKSGAAVARAAFAHLPVAKPAQLAADAIIVKRVQKLVPSLYGFEGIFSAMLQISRFVVSHELDDTRP